MKVNNRIKSIIVSSLVVLSIGLVGCSSIEDNPNSSLLPLDKIEQSKQLALDNKAIEGDLNNNGILDSTELDQLEKLNESNKDDNNKASVSEPITINKEENKEETDKDDSKETDSKTLSVKVYEAEQLITQSKSRLLSYAYSIKDISSNPRGGLWTSNTPEDIDNIHFIKKSTNADLKQLTKLFNELDGQPNCEITVDDLAYVISCADTILSLCDDTLNCIPQTFSNNNDFIEQYLLD